MTVSQTIRAAALELGFSACGIARYRRLDEQPSYLERWLRAGKHAGMEYMARHVGERLDPALLLPGVRSVIVCLAAYGQDAVLSPGTPRIASYAWGKDYHFVLKGLLGRLLEKLQEKIPGASGRAFVDSAPVLERRWAVEAGLGWIGRSSLLIHPRLGSRTFVGVLLTDAVLDCDEPYRENGCGSCRRCISACPAGAIGGDGTVDARRCLSYHTIENRGTIPPQIAEVLGNRLFGCETCQEACPHNSGVVPALSPLFAPVGGLPDVRAQEWLAMGSGEFRRRFAQTPLSRCGLRKLKETVRLIVADVGLPEKGPEKGICDL